MKPTGTVLNIKLQKDHNWHDALKEALSMDPMYYTPFYSCVIIYCFHILGPLYFENNAVPNRNRKNYDRLWKLRRVFSYLNA
jgi:hypothetical protein